MPKAYLYNNFITRNIRFSNKEAMTNRTLNNFYGEVDVNGCQVTNTNSYVDIIAPDWLTDDVMFGTTYVRFNNDSQYEYMAFVDSVEPSNFNNTTRYYRLYITVDWWSTIMWNSNITAMERIKEKVEGGVVRAHLNDVVKNGDDFNYYLDNTTFDEEFNVEKYVVESKHLNYNNTNKYFLYVLSSKGSTGGFAERNFFTVSRFVIGDKILPTPLNLCIVPLFRCDVKFSQITSDGTYERTESILNYTLNPDLIDDSSVFAIYCTDYCPYYNTENNTVELPPLKGNITVNDKLALYASTVIDTFSVYGGGSITGFRLFGEEEYGAPQVDVSSSDSVFNFITCKTKIYKPNTYYEYLNIIAKQYFPPYRYYTIENNDEKIVINTSKSNYTTIFSYNIVPSCGGYIFYMQDATKFGEFKYKMLFGDTYERIGTNDEFTQNRRATMVLEQLSKNVSVAEKYAGGFGKPSDIVGLYAENRNVYYNYKKMLRDGETGYNISSQPLAQLIKPIVVNCTRPLDEENKALRYDLAKYGYNTFLHPHEILLNHKRKYFNYIRCSNTSIDMPMYNTFIRKQIEEMFDNGVWLWNTDEEFGNFEVPNYCLIMEDENV